MFNRNYYGRPSSASTRPNSAAGSRRGFAGSNEDLKKRRQSRSRRSSRRQSDIGADQRRGSGVASLFGDARSGRNRHSAGVDANAATRVVSKLSLTPPKQKKTVEDWMQDNDTKNNISDDDMAQTRIISPLKKDGAPLSDSKRAAIASAVRRGSPRAKNSRHKELAQMPFEEELRRTQNLVRSSKGSLGLGRLDDQTEDDMIANIRVHARTIAEVLLARQKLLAKARAMWSSGDVIGMVLLLQWSREKAVMADILNNIGSRTLAAYEGSVMELVRAMVPIAKEMLSSTYEDYIIAGLRAIDLFIKASAHAIAEAAKDDDASLSQMLAAHGCCLALMDVRSDVKDLTGKSDPITHRVRRILAGLSHLRSELDASG